MTPRSVEEWASCYNALGIVADALKSAQDQCAAQAAQIAALEVHIGGLETILTEWDQKIAALGGERDTAIAAFREKVQDFADEIARHKETGARVTSLEAEVERLHAVHDQGVRRLREMEADRDRIRTDFSLNRRVWQEQREEYEALLEEVAALRAQTLGVDNLRTTLAPFLALATASNEIWALIEEGWLVRNTENDAHFPSYMAESVRLVEALKAFTDALAAPAVQRAIHDHRP